MTTPTPDIVVDVTVPDGPSVITMQDGTPHVVQVDENGRRFIKIKADFARVLLNSGRPECLPWKELNAVFAERLGPPPKAEAGVNIAAHLKAPEQMRPPHPRDPQGTLRLLGCASMSSIAGRVMFPFQSDLSLRRLR
jgi:hypothetical protein